MRSIGNTIGTYIDKLEPKYGMLTYSRICVEVDLEKIFFEFFQLTLYNWKQIQLVDYEQLLFNCK